MSPADSKNFHILVAEDNLVNQKVIGLYLKQMGHTFDCTENGEEAFQQYEHSNSYDLIIYLMGTATTPPTLSMRYRLASSWPLYLNLLPQHRR